MRPHQGGTAVPEAAALRPRLSRRAGPSGALCPQWRAAAKSPAGLGHRWGHRDSAVAACAACCPGVTCTTIMDRPAHLVTTSDNNPKYLVSELRQAVRPTLATCSIAQLLLYAQIFMLVPASGVQATRSKGCCCSPVTGRRWAPEKLFRGPEGCWAIAAAATAAVHAQQTQNFDRKVPQW